MSELDNKFRYVPDDHIYETMDECHECHEEVPAIVFVKPIWMFEHKRMILKLKRNFDITEEDLNMHVVHGYEPQLMMFKKSSKKLIQVLKVLAVNKFKNLTRRKINE